MYFQQAFLHHYSLSNSDGNIEVTACQFFIPTNIPDVNILIWNHCINYKGVGGWAKLARLARFWRCSHLWKTMLNGQLRQCRWDAWLSLLEGRGRGTGSQKQPRSAPAHSEAFPPLGKCSHLCKPRWYFSSFNIPFEGSRELTKAMNSPCLNHQLLGS